MTETEATLKIFRGRIQHLMNALNKIKNIIEPLIQGNVNVKPEHIHAISKELNKVL